MLLIHKKATRPWQENYLAMGKDLEYIHVLELVWGRQQEEARDFLCDVRHKFNRDRKNEVDRAIADVRFKLSILEKELAYERASHIQKANDGAKSAAAPAESSETRVVSEDSKQG